MPAFHDLLGLLVLNSEQHHKPSSAARPVVRTGQASRTVGDMIFSAKPKILKYRHQRSLRSCSSWGYFRPVGPQQHNVIVYSTC